jgi:hypothetical protein
MGREMVWDMADGQWFMVHGEHGSEAEDFMVCYYIYGIFGTR